MGGRPLAARERVSDYVAEHGYRPPQVFVDAVLWSAHAEFGGLSFAGVELDWERCVVAADRFVKCGKDWDVVPVGVMAELFLGRRWRGSTRSGQTRGGDTGCCTGGRIGRQSGVEWASRM